MRLTNYSKRYLIGMPTKFMKILLIQSYITVHNPETAFTEPLGLLSLASYLKNVLREKVDVNILDLFALGYDRIEKKGELYVRGISQTDEIIKIVEKDNPDIVGITCNFTAYAQDSLEVAQLIKKSLKEVVVVMGGAHATMDADQILKDYSCIDYIVRGEGEITFCELVNAIKNGLDIKSIQGISYRGNDGAVISTPNRDLIEDLNKLPIPDRKFINMDLYKKITSDALAFAKNNPVATIMTSRGCPFNCIFCSTKVMWRRKWRPRSTENVIKEIEYLVNEYGIKEIAIQDDQFIIDKKRVHEICDFIIRKKLKISLSIPSGTSIWLVDYDLLKKMKKAGFYRLCFPIETGNERTLKFIKKPVNLTKVKETIRLVNKLGYWTQGNFIFGFPYETREEISETIQYAYNSGLDYVMFFIAKPYAGSEMYEIYKKEGLLDSIVRSSHIERSDCDTKTMKAEELNKIYKDAVIGFWTKKIIFYMKPNNFYNYLLPKFQSFQDIKYAFKIGFALIKNRIIPLLKKYS